MRLCGGARACGPPGANWRRRTSRRRASAWASEVAPFSTRRHTPTSARSLQPQTTLAHASCAPQCARQGWRS
eukprot:8528059-Alexandrium_andersonii.AAC.1